VAAGAFTNLSRDHLDYHGDMANYMTVKLRLFSEVIADDGTAVIWADDSYAPRFIDLARERGLKMIRVGTMGEEIRITARTPTQLGQTLTLEIGGQTHTLKLPLIGAYQAANCLIAAGLVIATGGDVAITLANLARVQPVRGRLERAVITKTGAPVYVDYAHTADALEAAAEALRPHTKGRLILVFGAGGDRDTGKRGEMGKVAVRDADIVIVTDDNPRTEDPAMIRRAILKDAPGAREISGRRDAIAAAIAMAGADDVVLLAGKGHEQGQIVGDLVLPFDDVSVARECAA
jgi:UDP-N-acetylmuramoyl-L-alanyl-D-glutamate--2,6-diaminopimelate ligase